MEAGDHLRIYSDAKYALALGTWLYGIEYDVLRFETKDVERFGEIGERRQDGQGGEAKETGKVVKLFEKVRLALVGARQEVLIVA